VHAGSNPARGQEGGDVSDEKLYRLSFVVTEEERALLLSETKKYRFRKYQEYVRHTLFSNIRRYNTGERKRIAQDQCVLKRNESKDGL